MLFWIIAAALTVVACVAVLAPLARRPARDAADDGNDLRVYRDQLAEVDRDLARGAIGAADAEQARAEIGRRIMRIAGEAKAASPAAGQGLFRAVALVAVLSVPVVSWGLYAVLGSPALPAQPLAARLSKPPAQNSVEELVARAEAQLAMDPEDGRGWDVLAPTYTRIGRFSDAIAAYRNAIRIEGESAERAAGLAEAVSLAAGGIVSADAEKQFRRALELQPDMPKARFFLALGQLQSGKAGEAVATWQAMLKEPDLAPQWKRAAEYGLAQAQGTQAGPQSQVDAAADMSPQERAEMIETMVAGLDQKLRTEPDDPDGWIKLVRSYLVLGRNEAAQDALKRALEALGNDSAGGKQVAAFAAEQGMSVAE